MLELKCVEILLKGDPLFAPISCQIEAGQCLTLMGPSGIGKSSLLSWISGELDPVFEAKGQVFLDGEDITTFPPNRRKTGILFQDDLLFPHLSVGQNLAFGLDQNIKGQARQEAISKALFEADLAGFEDRDPATLSGGQRARVSCLRMLLSKPKAMLLDEAFSRLDQALRDRFRTFVFERIAAEQLPAILVTHDIADAKAAKGPIIHLQE